MKNINKLINNDVLKGRKIFPCKSNGKKPLTLHGHKDASSDVRDIKTWWSNYPDANIGLCTGKDANLIVVDIDVKNNAGGMESLQALEAEFEKLDTLVINTPSGGLHYYFSFPKEVEAISCMVGFRKGIDIRADGGYVIAPGSSIDGKLYEFEDIDKEIAELPLWLLDLLTNKETNNSFFDVVETVQGVNKGSRNVSLFKLSSSLVGRGFDYEDAKEQVLSVNSNCKPPLTRTEVLRCLDSAYSRYQPNNTELTEQHLTELGSAKEMINCYGENIRYVSQFGKWLLWDSHRWCFDETGNVSRLAKANALAQYDKVAQIDDFNKRQQMSRYATKSESRQAIESTIHLAKTEAGIPLRVESLDTNSYLLGVANGVINLRTGGLRVETKEEYITKQAPVEFNPDATCPRWFKFLNQAMDGDNEMIDYLKRIVGYSLTGDIKEQVLFFLFGHGANGKSVFVTTIQSLLGDYAMQTPVSTLMTRGKNIVNNDVARLRGARFVATTETEEGSKFNESELKQLTGGDVLICRFLYGEFFQYYPEFKIWISGNHKPVPGDGHSIWRRLILIPFEVIVDEANQDKELHLKLKEELSGILNWAIEGCLEWQEEGLKTPQKIVDAISEYKSEMDRVLTWMDERCQSKPRTGAETKASSLYKSYRKWAIDNGEWVMSQRIFSNKLSEKGYKKIRKGQGQFYQGISLSPEYIDDF
jgi:putative DNA primase/helicase